MGRRDLGKFLLVGLLSLIIGVGCIYLGTVVFETGDMFFLVIIGILLSALGLFLIALFIAPGTMLKILRQR
ncbi:hypothetical protein CEE45_16300 [Candidatus Heimdallarchaeota archaeon B3_Heim]|nr:MAG: hypothetical protein CEE45_16300 [Candidatus Heimdallarchaeota archaeon B3_Heim]